MPDKKKPYYGLAGIFSTDNPQSDQMQIDAESFDEDEWNQDEPLDDFDEEYYNRPTIHRMFECSVHTGHGAWYDWEECFESDDIEVMTKEMQAKHDEACNCGQPVKVS